MPETELVSVELFIIMNQDGEYIVNHDFDAATDDFNGTYSGNAVETTTIVIKMRAPKPVAREATATLPDDTEGGEVTLTLSKAE